MKVIKKILNLMKPQESFRGKRITIPLVGIFLIITLVFFIRDKWIKTRDAAVKKMIHENISSPYGLGLDDIKNMNNKIKKEENKQKR